jgi:hypothetical protein
MRHVCRRSDSPMLLGLPVLLRSIWCLRSPKKDRELQSAIKANRLLTVHQQHVGTKADHGEVGFKAGTARQYLVFPRSLAKFVGRKVIGINYDLLDGTVVKRPRAKPPTKSKSITPSTRSRLGPESKKIIAFKREVEVESDDDLDELKQQVRRAMVALEDGKAVAAFNILKRIVAE